MRTLHRGVRLGGFGVAPDGEPSRCKPRQQWASSGDPSLAGKAVRALRAGFIVRFSRRWYHQYDEHETQRPEIFYATIRIDVEVLLPRVDFASSTCETAGVLRREQQQGFDAIRGAPMSFWRLYRTPDS